MSAVFCLEALRGRRRAPVPPPLRPTRGRGCQRPRAHNDRRSPRGAGTSAATHRPSVKEGPGTRPLLTGGRKPTARPSQGSTVPQPANPSQGNRSQRDPILVPCDSGGPAGDGSGRGKGLLTPPYAQLELRLVQVLHIVAQEAVQQIRHHWFQHHGVGGPSAAAAAGEGSGAERSAGEGAVSAPWPGAGAPPAVSWRGGAQPSACRGAGAGGVGRS